MHFFRRIFILVTYVDYNIGDDSDGEENNLK